MAFRDVDSVALVQYISALSMQRRDPQLAFSFRTRGGARSGSGRKPKGRRAGVPHRVRERLAARHPVHVTLRLRRDVGSLRSRVVYRAFWKAWAAVRPELGLRLVHYSVQHDHVHLIVEVDGTTGLSRGMQGLCIRMARALNRALGRRGSVFTDRYHAHALRTPREVRNALVYVINNLRHHAAQRGVRLGRGFDPFSSAVWFEGWREGRQSWPKPETGPPPVLRAETWLLAVGYRRYPAPSLAEVPGGTNAAAPGRGV